MLTQVKVVERISYNLKCTYTGKGGGGEFDAFSFALSYPENPLVCLDLQPRLPIFSIGNVCSILSGVLLLCMQIKQIRVW